MKLAALNCNQGEAGVPVCVVPHHHVVVFVAALWGCAQYIAVIAVILQNAMQDCLHEAVSLVKRVASKKETKQGLTRKPQAHVIDHTIGKRREHVIVLTRKEQRQPQSMKHNGLANMDEHGAMATTHSLSFETDNLLDQMKAPGHAPHAMLALWALAAFSLVIEHTTNSVVVWHRLFLSSQWHWPKTPLVVDQYPPHFVKYLLTGTPTISRILCRLICST